MKKRKVQHRENSSALKATERLGETLGTLEKKILPSIKDAIETSKKEIQKFTDRHTRAFNQGYQRAKRKSKR